MNSLHGFFIICASRDLEPPPSNNEATHVCDINILEQWGITRELNAVLNHKRDLLETLSLSAGYKY